MASGAGVAFLPRLMVDHHDPAIRAVAVGEWLPARRMALFRPAGAEQSPGTAAVERAVRRAATARLAVGSPA